MPDAAAAHALALDIVRDLMRLPHVYGPAREWRENVFVITDETGTILAEVPYDALL